MLDGKGGIKAWGVDIAELDYGHHLIITMFFYHLLIALGGTATLTHAATSWIVPGAEWKSTAGAKIDAHGGMVVQEGDTFYWVGQAVSDGMLLMRRSSTGIRLS